MEAPPVKARPSQWIGRRKFLIDRRFQLKYTSILVLVGVAISAILGFCVFCLLRENRSLLSLDAAMMEQVQRVDNLTLIYLVGFVGLMALFLFGWGILITHRVAGPLLVVRRFLRELAEGRIPQNRPLRKRDELQDFYETFFAMVSALRARHAEELKLLEASLQELDKRPDALSPATREKLEALLQSKRAWGSPSEPTNK